MTFPNIETQFQREYLLSVRQALLMQVDAIERLLCVSPTTAELRRQAKEKRDEYSGKAVSIHDTA